MKNGQIGVGRHSSCDLTIDDRAVSMRQTVLRTSVCVAGAMAGEFWLGLVLRIIITRSQELYRHVFRHWLQTLEEHKR
jgi:hypothetical protein